MFIYVFDSLARDILLNDGLVLIKNDEGNSIYVFYADDNAAIEYDDISYITSDSLSF